jgi:threonylcarbamoyladenosine tRNA methylthiotransferase MtaB
LQSGCDDTLKRMNRKYNCKEFKKSVELLRKTFTNVALTTDIIVGFPGETDKEFDMTYEFLKDIEFEKMHVFKYSKRKGTPAYSMPNQVDGKIKELRSQKLIELSNQNEKNFLNKYIGKNISVLFEQKEEEYIKGHTTNYIVVKTKDNIKENQIADVKIKEIDNLELIGNVTKM